MVRQPANPYRGFLNYMVAERYHISTASWPLPIAKVGLTRAPESRFLALEREFWKMQQLRIPVGFRETSYRQSAGHHIRVLALWPAKTFQDAWEAEGRVLIGRFS